MFVGACGGTTAGVFVGACGGAFAGVPVGACGGSTAAVSVVACGAFAGANPWACTAYLWIGFAGWLFGGLTLLGPPAISFREDFFVP